MQEEFEKKIQERMHTFGIQPSYQVWDDIDAVLSKKKHRRVFVGWWILLGLVAVGGGVFFYEKDSILHNTINQQPVITKDTTNNNLAKITAPATVEKENIATTAPLLDTLNTAGVQQNGTRLNDAANKTTGKEIAANGATARLLQQGKTTGITTGTLTRRQNNAAAAQNNDAPKQDDKPAEIAAVNAGVTKPTDEAAATTLYTGKEPATSIQANDSAVNNKQQPAPMANTKKMLTTQATDVPAKSVTNIIKARAARHQWFFTLAGGTTQTTAPGALNQGKNSGFTSAAYYNANVIGLTSLAAYKYDLVKPGTGFNIAAGATYQHNLSKKWRIAAGAQLAYLTNTQKTGLLYYNDAFTGNNPAVNNSTFLERVTVASYYQAQSLALNTEVNRAWQLQVPVTASYIINPGGKTKFMLNGGASAALMLGSKWLIPDSRYGKLYYDKSALNNTLFSWQAGPSMELHNQLQLGVRYEQSITTFAKKYITPNLYWQNISIYAAIPFKGKTKK